MKRLKDSVRDAVVVEAKDAVHGSLGVAATSEVNGGVHSPVYRTLNRTLGLPLDVVYFAVHVEMENLK